MKNKQFECRPQPPVLSPLPFKLKKYILTAEEYFFDFGGKEGKVVSRQDLMWKNETHKPATVFSCNENCKNLLGDEVLQEAVVSGYTMRVGPAARHAEVSNIRPVSGFRTPDAWQQEFVQNLPSCQFCCEKGTKLCICLIPFYVTQT